MGSAHEKGQPHEIPIETDGSDERWPGTHNLALAGLNHGDAMRSVLQSVHMG